MEKGCGLQINKEIEIENYLNQSINFLTNTQIHSLIFCLLFLATHSQIFELCVDRLVGICMEGTIRI
jgi:hypothetical protein